MQTEPRKPIIQKSSTFFNESVSFNKLLNENEEKLFNEFMEKDSITTYTTSSNGFWYSYITKSSENYLPQAGDQLLYSLEVLDLNENIIYSFEEVGEKSYFVDQESLEEGLRNGLKLMNEGDFVTFLFPSHKVFGYLGDENKIGINQPLIYKVKLNKIKKKNESN
jgi:gliding motility-associated peptidyl-prolyl isomerase